jgi:7tm Odorant receptor
MVDTLFTCFCHQVIASYHYLGQEFLEIDRMFGYSQLSKVRERLVEAKFQLLIYQHGRMVEIISMIEKTFGPLIFIFFGMSVAVLAVTVYEASQVSYPR